MVSKVTASLALLGATLFTIPVYAEPSTVPRPAAVGTPGAPAKPDSVAPAPAKQELKLAAEPESSDVDTLDLKYAKNFLVDTGKIVAAPIHWESGDWLKVGMVVGTTGALMLVDEKIKDFAQSHQGGVASKFAMIGNDQGTPLYILPMMGAVYGYGALTDDHRARRAALLAVESYAVSGIFTEGIKTLGGRHRPNTGASSTTWDGPSLKNASFSSGHTASAFSVATIFANEYQDNAWVPPVAYGLATLTGLSRIYSNEHWSSDVFFGGAVGYFTSKALLSFHKEDKNRLLGNRLMVTPSVSKEMTGVSMSYKF